MLFTESLAEIHEKGTVASIDGKTIRNSGSDKALYIVSALCEANQLYSRITIKQLQKIRKQLINSAPP